MRKLDKFIWKDLISDWEIFWKVRFNNGNYTLNVAEETSLLLYNPERDLPIHLEVKPNSWLVSVLISIKKFQKNCFSLEDLKREVFEYKNTCTATIVHIDDFEYDYHLN